MLIHCISDHLLETLISSLFDLSLPVPVPRVCVCVFDCCPTGSPAPSPSSPPATQAGVATSSAGLVGGLVTTFAVLLLAGVGLLWHRRQRQAGGGSSSNLRLFRTAGSGRRYLTHQQQQQHQGRRGRSPSTTTAAGGGGAAGGVATGGWQQWQQLSSIAAAAAVAKGGELWQVVSPWGLWQRRKQQREVSEPPCLWLSYCMSEAACGLQRAVQNAHTNTHMHRLSYAQHPTPVQPQNRQLQRHICEAHTQCELTATKTMSSACTLTTVARLCCAVYCALCVLSSCRRR